MDLDVFHVAISFDRDDVIFARFGPAVWGDARDTRLIVVLQSGRTHALSVDRCLNLAAT